MWQAAGRESGGGRLTGEVGRHVVGDGPAGWVGRVNEHDVGQLSELIQEPSAGELVFENGRRGAEGMQGEQFQFPCHGGQAVGSNRRK